MKNLKAKAYKLAIKQLKLMYPYKEDRYTEIDSKAIAELAKKIYKIIKDESTSSNG